MRIVFIGPPGVGKGTQSARLIKYLKIPHLSTGDMLRQARQDKTDLGILADEYMSHGKLVPDPLILQLIERRLDQEDCREGCLLDGFPRTLGQAKEFDAFLARRGTPLSVVLELTADVEEVIKRLSARGRDDDKPEVVRERLKEHEQRTAPLSDYYRKKGLLRTIDGLGTPEAVFERVRAVLDRVA